MDPHEETVMVMLCTLERQSYESKQCVYDMFYKCKWSGC